MFKKSIAKLLLVFLIFLPFWNITFSSDNNQYQNIAEKAFQRLEKKFEGYSSVKKMIYYTYLSKKLEKIKLEIDNDVLEMVITLLIAKIENELDTLRLDDNSMEENEESQENEENEENEENSENEENGENQEDLDNEESEESEGNSYNEENGENNSSSSDPWWPTPDYVKDAEAEHERKKKEEFEKRWGWLNYYEWARSNPMTGQWLYFWTCSSPWKKDTFSYIHETSQWSFCHFTNVVCDVSGAWKITPRFGVVKWQQYDSSENTYNTLYADRHCWKDPLRLWWSWFEEKTRFAVSPTEITIDIANKNPLSFYVTLLGMHHSDMEYCIQVTNHPFSPSSVSDSCNTFANPWWENWSETSAYDNWGKWDSKGPWRPVAMGWWSFHMPYDHTVFWTPWIEFTIHIRDAKNPGDVIDVNVKVIDSSLEEEEEEE